MLDWLSQHSTAIQTLGSVVTAIIWIVYLQVFVSSFKRQRQSEILIHLGGSDSINPRVFVSNLSYENIYVIEILFSVKASSVDREASVMDRTEIDHNDLDLPSSGTVQGPLASGEYVDIGSVENLFHRFNKNSPGDNLAAKQVKTLEVTVVAITAATTNIVAAKREFTVSAKGDNLRLIPTSLYAEQIRSWWGRRRIEQKLNRRLNE